MNWVEHTELLEEAVSEVDRVAKPKERFENPENITDMMCMMEAVVGQIWDEQEEASNVSLDNFKQWFQETVE